MKKETRMKLEKVFDTLGEIIAFCAVVILALYLVNLNYPFLPSNVAAIFYGIKEWVGLVLIAVTGLECTIKRNIIIRIIFYVLLVVIIALMFFPGSYNWVMGMIPSK